MFNVLTEELSIQTEDVNRLSSEMVKDVENERLIDASMKSTLIVLKQEYINKLLKALKEELVNEFGEVE